MLECDPMLTPSEVKGILERTAVSVTDPKNGRSYPSIRAAAAVEEACAATGGSGAGGETGVGGEAGVRVGGAGPPFDRLRANGKGMGQPTP